MNYKYHHKVLELLYSKLDLDNEESKYSAKMLSEKLKIRNVDRARSIMTSLREFECLNSKYDTNQKDVFFWITDSGISKFHEHYFKYKRKEQLKVSWTLGLKLLFYTISTVGIITSIIYNIFSTRTIIDKIKDQYFQDTPTVKYDSLLQIHDSINY